jgi:hypothetical protein
LPLFATIDSSCWTPFSLIGPPLTPSREARGGEAVTSDAFAKPRRVQLDPDDCAREVIARVSPESGPVPSERVLRSRLRQPAESH